MSRAAQLHPAPGEVDSAPELVDLVRGERTSVTRRYALRVDEGIVAILARDLPLPLPTPSDSRRLALRLEPIHARGRSGIGRVLCCVTIGLFLVWGGIAARLWSHTSAAAPSAGAAVPSPSPPPTRSASRLRLPVTVKVDASGLPLEIVASDPGRVLAAFCRAVDGGQRYRPSGLSAAPPPATGIVLGHVEDRFDVARRAAIRIYLDPRTARWQAGDRRSPIPLSDPGAQASTRKFGPDGPPEVELRFERVVSGATPVSAP